MTTEATFQADQDRPQLVVDLGAYEGPVDLLLQMARDQKVDLLQISILALAEQYIAFIHAAKDLELEIAADYLVMAAWLAYLKSRLLLPKEAAPAEEEPSPEALAAALARRLQRLAALQSAAQALFQRPRLGIDRFSRGAHVAATVNIASDTPNFDVDFNDLLQAYAAIRRRKDNRSLSIRRSHLHTVEAALARLNAMIGIAVEWRALESFLPLITGDRTLRQSAWASTFAAGLQLAKEGRVAIRQDAAFGPIYFRAADRKDRDDD